MRKTALSSLLFLTIGLQAQTTFAPEGATWMYDVVNPWTGGIYQATFTATGDTVVQDITCQRIELVGTPPCSYFTFPGFPPPLLTYTSGDSVFWFDRISEEFRLLVPFNAPSGSSWQVTLASYVDDPTVHDVAKFTVVARDQIVVDGQTLRRMYVSATFLTSNGYLSFPSGMGTFTERLGHSYFMIPWMRACADAPMPTGLVCYNDPDMSWPDPDVPCAIWTGTRERDHEAGPSVTPTLLEAGGTIRVSAELPYTARAQWQVTDVLGRTVREGNFQGPSMLLALELRGTFLITLRTEHAHVLSQRVVVQ